MPRPHKCRFVGSAPPFTVFKPQGIPSRSLDIIDLRLDELEAIRLADLEGLYHDAAASEMGISRATFGRLLEEARHKVADALLNAKGLVFKGGEVIMEKTRTFDCRDCGSSFQAPCGTGRPAMCPSCSSENFHRAAHERHQGQGCGNRDGSGRGHHERRRCRQRATADPVAKE